MTDSAVTRTKPRDLKPGDVLRIEKLDADVRVVTEDKVVKEVSYLPTHRYAVRLEGEAKPIYISQTSTVNVVTSEIE